MVTKLKTFRGLLLQEKEKQQEQPISHAYLPYVAEVSDRLRRDTIFKL